MKDTLERTREPELDLRSYLSSAYVHPVFKGGLEDQEEEGAPFGGGYEGKARGSPVLVPTKRQSRRNTPVPSRHSGSLSPRSVRPPSQC